MTRTRHRQPRVSEDLRNLAADVLEISNRVAAVDRHLGASCGQPAQAALALRDQPRLEGPGPVPGHVQRHWADRGGHRFRGRPVSRVRRTPAGRINLVVSDMPGQFRGRARSGTALIVSGGNPP